MSKQFVMGNEAIALGAIRAGVKSVSGYPGTPSTEVLETVAKYNPGDVYVEWSVNEKAGLEVAAAAAYAGARSMVTMKQVGLNVASDPLMSLAYMGIKGGMVVLVADDPGPISSQTEQDTRKFAEFSKLPCFDPASPEEAYAMIADAFDYSEKYNTPVLFRPTTRVCHGCATVDIAMKDAGQTGTFTGKDLERKDLAVEGFVKDTMRWVVFPRTSYQNHIRIEKQLPVIGDAFSEYGYNTVTGNSKAKKGIVTGGISAVYTEEFLHTGMFRADAQVSDHGEFKILRVATPFPFPEKLALQFLEGLEEVLVIEELDPVLEDALVMICGKHHLQTRIIGKRTLDVQLAGENTVESVHNAIAAFGGMDKDGQAALQQATEDAVPQLPVRPPVLCAGCPHRASFYAVKQAMKGQKAVFCGDIGCYTLGNAKPLDMVDTCLCMGAGITMAQGLYHMEPEKKYFAFVGDSTFFAAGLTGIANAVYNQADMTVVILDNSTTAMTGHQPHPGTGRTMMGEVVAKIDIQAVLTGLGVSEIEEVNPMNLTNAVTTVQRLAEKKGVKAVIFKYPCIAIHKPEGRCIVEEDKCINCRKCINELGCPALVIQEGRVTIEPSLCTGCGLCSQVCPKNAIVGMR